MDAKTLEAHRALEKKIAAANADARKLLDLGQNVGHVVRQITEAHQALRRRLTALEASLPAPDKA